MNNKKEIAHMDDFSADLLTLTGEDGTEMEFQILDEIDVDGEH